MNFAALPSCWAEVGPIEAHEVIDAIAVEQLSVAARTLPQPAEITFGQHIPAIHGKAPILSGLAGLVGRRADRGVEPEFVLPRPHVGAVGAHHERQVSEQGDVARRRARRVPLLVGDPLQVPAVQDVVREIEARLRERGRLPFPQRRGPLEPRPLTLARAQRAKEGVLIEPPGLLVDVRLKPLSPWCMRDPLAVAKPRKRLTENGLLQVTHVRVVDARRSPEALEPHSKVGLEPRLASEQIEILELVHGDEQRVDRHRAERRIG